MRLDKLLGIRYPLIQGGMANIATGEFAAAVSNAGALGVIASGGVDAEGLRREIRIAREGVRIVTTGAGSPGKYMPLWKERGIKVFPVVSGRALAVMMERCGADAVIAEGTESGGHVGEMTTMTLVPQVADAVKIPVIAAGGIADGRQLAAAFALGAIGAQIGTCLLVAEECPIHEAYKQALLKARDNATTVTGRIAGTPVRVLKNEMARQYVKREKEGATVAELEQYTLGSLRKAVKDGDILRGSLMAGQVAGQLKEIRSLSDILSSLWEEAQLRTAALAEVVS